MTPNSEIEFLLNQLLELKHTEKMLIALENDPRFGEDEIDLLRHTRIQIRQIREDLKEITGKDHQ